MFIFIDRLIFFDKYVKWFSLILMVGTKNQKQKISVRSQKSEFSYKFVGDVIPLNFGSDGRHTTCDGQIIKKKIN